MKTQFIKLFDCLIVSLSHCLIVSFCLLPIAYVNAQIRTSVQTGNWGTATTWDCGCVPAPTENAVIANGHTVTLTANTTINGLTINTGGTLSDNGKIMTVTGNLLLNGNLDGSRDLNLTGSGATIDGTGTKSNNMGSVTISNGNKTILTSANLNIAGAFDINAGLSVTNYGTITIANNITGGNASSTWINESNSTLNAGNTVLNTGTLTASAAGNTVNYNRAGAQTVKMPGSSTYSNLNIEGNNTKTLPGNMSVSGNLTITSTLDVSGNNYNLNIGGNWNNSGTFEERLGIVTFDGTASQSITNTLGETFYNLALNKSAGTLTLNNSVIISNALIMTSGRIDAASATLTLGTACGNQGTLTYTAGAVIGKFERWINAVSPANFLFPVGTSSDYRPALITFNVLSPCGSLIGEFVASDPGINGLPLDDGISPDSIRNTFAEGYWTLNTANGLASSDYNLELTGNGFTSFPINAPTRLLTRSDAGSPWNNPPPGTHVAASGNTAKRNNITVISAQYAFGDTTKCEAPVTSGITGADSVCNSAVNVPYSVDLHLGSVYTWTITGGTQSGGGNTESITVNWGSAGMAGNVRVVENNGCSNGVPVDKAVNIHTLPTSSITGSNTVAEFTNGEPYSVTARPGYTYTWTITGGNLASGQGTNNITVNWLGAGTGNVRCVASTGCPGTADPVDLPITIYSTITSIATGLWSASTTWSCSCVPPTTGSVVITSPYTVTLSANTTIKNFTINTGGNLAGSNRIMTVTGNLTVSGTYTSTNSIKLTGTGNATLAGTGTISAGSISIEGGNVNIASSANLTVSSGNLIFNKAGLSVSNNGAIAFDFSIVNGMGTVTFINEANSTLKIGGTIDGVFSASATGNTVNYSGGGVQNIKCPSSGQYYNLSVSNAGTKTLTCNIDIDGNVSISGTAQLDVSSYNMNIAGNWTNTSSNADPFFERSQTVVIDGTGAQSITYTPGETFYNLTINKSSGTLTLNDNVTATNALTMSGGNIDAGADTLKLGSPAGDGTLSWTSGTVIGRFQRWLSSAGGKLFPIGVSTDYRPALVTFTSLTGGSLTAQFVGTNPGVNGLPLNDAGVNIYNTFTEGFWDLTAANGLASANYDLDLTGNGFTSYTINSSTRILKRTSSANPWTLDGIHASASGNTAKRTGVNGVSDFEFCFGDTSACAPPVTSSITGADSVCAGQTGVSYSVTDSPPNTYAWTITGGVQSGGGNTNSITVNWDPAPGGTGNVNVLERSNCGNGTPVDLAVNIHTLPTSSITGKDAVVEFSTGEPYSVMNNPGYSYTWTITGGSVASGQGTNSITVNWGAAGAGNVNVVASSNCTPDAAPVNLPVTIYGTITSIKSGNWDGDTTWNCSCVPLTTDNIVIANTHTVTLTVADTINNITINSGGTLDNGTNVFTVTGDYTVNGTHSGIGNIILSGTGTTVAGTGTISNMGELQITVGNKTIVSSASLTKSSGNFSIATAVTVINNGTITIGGDIVGIAASSTWVNGAGATLNIGGALLSTGTLTASATGNTLNYNGAAAQNIKSPSSSYYNLTASGSGIKTLTGNIDVNGNLTINSSLDVSLTNYNINLAGGWNNTGAFNELNGTVIIDGSGAQSLTNIAGETFYNLTMNKTAGTFTLNDNATVSNAFTMTAGNINTGTDTLILGTSTANVGTLIRTSGNIIGRFKRWKNSTPATLTFPVGTSTNYRPALVTFNSVAGGTLTDEFVASAPGNNGMPVVDGAFTIDNTFTEGYWTLTAANGLSSSDYNLELTGNGFTSFTVTAETRLLSRATSGSPWDNPPGGSHAAAVPATKTAKRTGLSSFTQYAFGDTTACAGPATSAITGDDSVCTGVTGKIYFVTNNAPNTYTWTVVGGSITSGQGTSSITVTWGSTGRADANVRVIETDVCTNGTPVDLPVIIHTLPTSPITGNNSVAAGTLGEPYSVTNTPGYTYTWEIIPGTNGTIASGQFTNSITVNWGAAGSETVRVTASMGCGAAAPVNLPVTIYSIITSNATGNWNAPATWNCACVPPASGSVIIQNIHTVTLTQNETIKNLTLTGAVASNGFALTVTGNFTLNGSYAGTGDLNLDGIGTTIAGTGQMSNTGTVRIRNGNKTISPGTDITKVQGGSFTILGGLIVTNNGDTMTIASDLIGGSASSTWVNGANSTLKVFANVLTTGTLTATAANNTVEYYGDATQNVKQTTYYNLSVTGSGGKTTLSTNMNMTGNMNITDTLDANGFDISVGGNWTNSGGGRFIPSTGKVIFNGTGTNTINNGTQAFNNLDIAGSGTKTLGNNLTVNGNLSITSALDAGADYPVNIKGNWSNTGTFNSNNGIVTFDGTALQTLQNTTTFNNLTINNAAGVSVASGANNLKGTLTLTSGTFNTNNSFTLISNSSATARIAAITGGDIFGDIIMQRYVNAGATGWHFISSAVSGTTANDWDQEMILSIPDGNEGCSGSPCYYSVYRYNEATPGAKENGYVAVTTVAEPINPGEGYWVYTGTGPSTTVPFTFDARGPANKFANSLPVSFTNSGLPSEDGWNMVSNPYPSTIDWDAAGWAKTNMANAIYVWDPDAGIYASYVGGVGAGGGSRFIPSSQAFWVKATGAPTLTATEPVKSAIDQPYFKLTDIPGVFRLSISGAGFADETVIRFAQGAGFAFDSDMDAYKLSYAYSPAPYLATVIEDSTDLSINTLPVLTQDTSIPLRVKWIGAWWISGETGTFTISTSDLSTLPLSACIILEDMQTGISTNLRTDSSYTFTLSDTASSPRFLLHTGAAVIKEVSAVSCFDANDGVAIAQGNGTGPWDYEWTTGTGDTIKVTQNIFTADTISNLTPGVYYVKVTNGSALCGDVSDSIIITEPDPITVSINQTNVNCKGGSNGTAAAAAAGGSPPYTYLWNDTAATTAATAANLPAGNYNVIITDNNGCTQTADATITEPPTIVSAGFTVNKDTSYLSEGGTVQFANNSTGALSYQWNFGDGTPVNTSTNPAHSYTSTGTYLVTLIAINGTCQDTFTYNVIILENPPVSIRETVALNESIKILSDKNGAIIEFNFDRFTWLSISVCNLLGQKIIEDNNRMVKQDRMSLDLPVRGVYFIKIVFNDSHGITRKFNYFK